MDVPEDRLFLCFAASQNEPDYTGIFLTAGGQLNAAASPWDTDFSVSGSKETSVASLCNNKLTEIKVEIPKEMFTVQEKMDTSGNNVKMVVLPVSIRLNACTSRIGTAINGTIVSTVSGQGSEYLCQILKPGKTHSQMGLVYSSWAEHAASIGISEARVVMTGADGDTEQNVFFEAQSEQTTDALASAAKIVNAYVQTAWSIREQLVYTPSPALTKTVFKEVVGVDAQGYSLVHDIVTRGAPMALETLEQMFEACIKARLEYDDKNIEAYEQFINYTNKQSYYAACEGAHIVASATSLLVSYLVAYRVDGRNCASATGTSDFSAAESWLRQTTRSCIEANDCDGSALLAVGVLNAAMNMSKEQEAKHKHLACIKNTLCPHYSVGICIVGASAAEATSADGEHTAVAGHAIALAVPNLHLLRALEKASEMELGETKTCVVKEGAREGAAEARFRALFPSNVVGGMSDYDKKHLTSWKVARDISMFSSLEPLAIEGTTPASSVLYVPNAKERRDAENDVAKDDVALGKASPNAFRSLKRLHVGGSCSGSTHRFYRDMVEITFPRTFPLWKDEKLRELSLAATQYLFCRNQATKAITTVGATPKDLQMQEFMALPLVIGIGKTNAEILDYASVVAEKDVIPPRPPGPLVLNDYQKKCFEESCQHLDDLDAHFLALGFPESANEDDEKDAHCVHYVPAFSTLVHNPAATEHFCKTMKAIASHGICSNHLINGMAVDSDGIECGCFVSIAAYIPV